VTADYVLGQLTPSFKLQHPAKKVPQCAPGHTTDKSADGNQVRLAERLTGHHVGLDERGPLMEHVVTGPFGPPYVAAGDMLQFFSYFRGAKLASPGQWSASPRIRSGIAKAWGARARPTRSFNPASGSADPVLPYLPRPSLLGATLSLSSDWNMRETSRFGLSFVKERNRWWRKP